MADISDNFVQLADLAAVGHAARKQRSCRLSRVFQSACNCLKIVVPMPLIVDDHAAALAGAPTTPASVSGALEPTDLSRQLRYATDVEHGKPSGH